jgi:hypothetical protein
VLDTLAEVLPVIAANVPVEADEPRIESVATPSPEVWPMKVIARTDKNPAMSQPVLDCVPEVATVVGLIAATSFDVLLNWCAM